MKPTTQNASPGPAVRVLKSATCPSLSGKSKLLYDVGCTGAVRDTRADRREQLAGSFSREWVDMQAIRAALDKFPRGAPVTSGASRPVPRHIERTTNSSRELSQERRTRASPGRAISGDMNGRSRSSL